jgi:two-component system, cell cycle sensor histidine kinase and response regulator CckA
MKQDDLTWLCAELGLPVFEETGHGLLASVAAQAAVRSAEGSIAEAAANHLGLPADHPALLSAIAIARRGERAAVLAGPNAAGLSFRLLATPVTRSGSRIRLTLAPAPGPRASEGLIEVAAAVSHEVANAVGSIRGLAELALHESDASVELRDALTLIRGAAGSAEQAARSMLGIARGEAQSEPTQRLDLSEFTSGFVQLLTLTARQARVKLEASIAPGQFVHATRAQLFTIVFNLVKNAIEACPAGGLVSVHLERSDEYATLSVRDTGAGLDRSAQERLFERYYTTKNHGTGLGLVLVRSAVDALAAEIQVESELGRGTVFRVIFPRVDDGSGPHLGWLAARREATPLHGPALDARILVIDDDQALREMLTTMLSLRGARVVSAASCDEALAVEGRFDLALIDMMLEGCRGDELLALLRQRGVVNAAMLVTGTVQKPRLVPGGEPDDWVRKPFEISQLVDRIRRTLERHRMLHHASTIARA